MFIDFSKRTIFWNIPKWNRAPTKSNKGSIPTVVHVTFLQRKRYELMDPFVFLSFIDNSIATTSGEGGIQTLVLLINETKQYH